LTNLGGRKVFGVYTKLVNVFSASACSLNTTPCGFFHLYLVRLITLQTELTLN
jgi:hypothetical protein